MKGLEDLLNSLSRLFELRRRMDAKQDQLNKEMLSMHEKAGLTLIQHEERLKRLENRDRPEG